MAWEWQVWRCFDHIREAFEEKSWQYGFVERNDNSMMPPLLAESDGLCIAFFRTAPGTGECWFELRDKARRKVVFVRGVQNIPTPECGEQLLANYGTSLGKITAPRDLPLYSLPMAPMTEVG